MGTAQVNQSIYGLITKLRVAGVTWLDRPTGRAIARGCAVLVIGLALIAGWRMRADPVPLAGAYRLGTAMLFLAILNLAAAFSPFVGVAYGTYGTVWLTTLLLASSRDRGETMTGVAVLALVLLSSVAVASPRRDVRPETFTIVASLVGHVAALAVNGWVVWAWFARRRPGHAASHRGPDVPAPPLSRIQ